MEFLKTQESLKSNLDWALYYRSLGWSVFPITTFREKRTDGKEKIVKKPIISEWKKYQNEIASEEQIKEWWTKNPKAGIAIITGKISNLFVLDVDEGGDESIYNLLPIDTVSAMSGSGGLHYYFQHPGYEIKNSASLIGKNLDIRGDGGFIAAAPSRYIDDKFYEWIAPPIGHSIILKAPRLLLEHIEATKYSLMPIRESHSESPVSHQNQSVPESKDWEKLIDQGVTEGSRNATAAKLIGRLIRNLSSEDWKTTAWPELFAWNKKNEPPLSDRELLNIYNSITNTEQKKRVKIESAPIKQEPNTQYQYLRLNPLANAVRWTDNARLNQIVGHAQLGQMITFYGRAGSGKTSFAKKILEHNSDKFGACFISLENTQTSLDETSFNQWMYINKHHNTPFYIKDYIYAADFAKFEIHTKEQYRQFVEQFIIEDAKKKVRNIQLNDCSIPQLIKLILEEAKNGIKLFGLDSFTLIKYENTDKNSTDQIKEGIMKLKNTLESQKLILFGVSHATITEDGDRVYGSSHYNNFSDKVIEIRSPKKPNDILLRTISEDSQAYIHKELYWHKNRPYEKDFGVQYLYEKGTGNITNVQRSQDDTKDIKQPQKEINVNDMLKKLPN